MVTPPSASFSITVRCRYLNLPGMLARVAQAIGDAGGDIRSVDLVEVASEVMTREFTVHASDGQQVDQIIRKIGDVPGVELVDWFDRTFRMHAGGKLSIEPKSNLLGSDELSMAYTPGVARVCMAIKEQGDLVRSTTIKGNTVAVVTDGTAVLGLGDIGPEAALPVMEGKAVLFKEFGRVDAFPICLDTKDPNEIVDTVARIAPVFGGINLEDISAPRCFEIEEQLQNRLGIPVFHDDQHGTAVVVMAALINALKIVEKKLTDLRVLISGVGAAGVACTKILLRAGVADVIGLDRHGALYQGRSPLDTPIKRWYASNTNIERRKGSVSDVISGVDLYLGLSGPGLVTCDDIKKMAPRSIVFALSNPEPEIRPEAISDVAEVVATGRSDYPNQINNVLCFPGFFRGLLDSHAPRVTDEMKDAAASAIAGVISEDQLRPDEIVPSVFQKSVAPAVADAVASRQELIGRQRESADALRTGEFKS